MKRKLTHDQEFDILKMILDKYLWLGTLVMVFGLWKITQSSGDGFIAGGSAEGIVLILAGSIVMFVLLWIIVKEYEFIK